MRWHTVFGSAARVDDFNFASSDAHFLVEFALDAQPGLDAFLGAEVALEQSLGRGVDLVEPGAVRNPYVLASINRNREAVYAARSACVFVGCARGHFGHSGLCRRNGCGGV